MSLILDALSRAERDKRRDLAPDLLAQPQHEPSLSSRRWLVPGAIAIALLLAMVLWFLLSHDDEGAAVTPIQVPPVELSATGTETAVRRREAPEAVPVDVTEPAPETLSEAVRALYETADAQDETQGREATRMTHSGQVSTPVSVARATAEPAASKAMVPDDVPEPVEELVDLEQVLRDVRIAAANKGLTAHETPLLAEQSKQFRDRVPTLMYLRHDFDALGQSTVLINGQTLRVGQSSRGVELREVLVDSVILRFDGTDFRLRALNSWVNL
jgi:general secretion pathway protein B